MPSIYPKKKMVLQGARGGAETGAAAGLAAEFATKMPENLRLLAFRGAVGAAVGKVSASTAKGRKLKVPATTNAGEEEAIGAAAAAAAALGGTQKTGLRSATGGFITRSLRSATRAVSKAITTAGTVARRANSRSTDVTASKTEVAWAQKPDSCYNVNNKGYYWGDNKKIYRNGKVFWSKMSIYTNPLGMKDGQLYKYYNFPDMELNYGKLQRQRQRAGRTGRAEWSNVDHGPPVEAEEKVQVPMQMVMLVIAEKLLANNYNLYLDWCDKDAFEAIEQEYQRQRDRRWTDAVADLTKDILEKAASNSDRFIWTEGAGGTSQYCKAEESGGTIGSERKKIRSSSSWGVFTEVSRLRKISKLPERQIDMCGGITLKNLKTGKTLQQFLWMQACMDTRNHDKICQEGDFYIPNPEDMADGLLEHLTDRKMRNTQFSGLPPTASSSPGPPEVSDPPPPPPSAPFGMVPQPTVRMRSQTTGMYRTV